MHHIQPFILAMSVDEPDDFAGDPFSAFRFQWLYVPNYWPVLPGQPLLMWVAEK